MVTTTNYVCSVAAPVVAVNALAVDAATTSTVYSTSMVTVTSCAPTVTGCPGNSGGGSYPTSDYSTSEPSPTATTIGCVGNPVTSWKTVTTVCTEHLPFLFDTRSWAVRWILHNCFSCNVTMRGLIVLRGTIYLGVSSPLLRGQHQYRDTTSHIQYPDIHYPNTQCPDSDFSGVLCFFHRVYAMKGATNSGKTVIVFDLTYSDTGLGCSDDCWHYGIDHRGSHNHGENYRECHVGFHYYSLFHDKNCVAKALRRTTKLTTTTLVTVRLWRN